MKRVAVLMGGASAEREVSLVSGKACAEALRAEGYDVTTIDAGRDVTALIAALDPHPDVVFNALHGRWGEDGCVQGVLNLMGIPYTHSGLLASALAMDKPMAKRVFQAAGLRCPGGRLVTREEFAKGEPMARPYVMKPYNEGSSVGVRIVRQGDNVPPATSWSYGSAALVEPYIAGRELTVAVMGDRPLAVTELKSKTNFYDYEAKYTDGITQHLVPAPLPAKVYDAALAMALAAHQVLGCRGVSRSDFRYDDTKGEGPEHLYLLEVNTQPGMTPLSLAPEQAKHAGISFRALVSWMVENAQCDA
ncbi:MAG TPA: D-alanine--D-alanine ligase [Hypericibacter adhaerens]|jgi:D-alanine-D-alanine ligase|uniref:D-alanine--D-alanine ligase n=1 Tax=Hypericibacter adhaerens TaxID=2602016 RepID=A0A5J6MY77_9PROT|nr:D-alanine--D-alanine ligase [Hypericibacter adhaerens]QEX21220.1 D-alanine--D-alanine ligase [Hypericibacter adhaerens]HWA43408.1 D-alanine--D-alanine ligase [Hypericibacter adhaerens]